MNSTNFDYAGRKILVTGASGFIGSSLCHKLIELRAEVHATSRRQRSAHAKALQWWQWDMVDLETMRKVFHSVQPEIIFHLASHVSGSRDLDALLPTFQANLVSTVNLLTLAAHQGCQRVVLAGSSEEPELGPVEPVPCSPYAAAKWAGSGYARMFHQLYKLPVVTARIFMSYGPGQADVQKLIPYVTLSLLKGVVPGLSSGSREVDWIYVEDVVSGLLAAGTASNVEGAAFDLGTGIPVSIRTVVEKLSSLLKSPIEPVFGALPERPFERLRIANTSHSYEKLGWKAVVSLDEGLIRTAQWYHDHLDEFA